MSVTHANAVASALIEIDAIVEKARDYASLKANELATIFPTDSKKVNHDAKVRVMNANIAFDNAVNESKMNNNSASYGNSLRRAYLDAKMAIDAYEVILKASADIYCAKYNAEMAAFSASCYADAAKEIGKTIINPVIDPAMVLTMITAQFYNIAANLKSARSHIFLKLLSEQEL